MARWTASPYRSGHLCPSFGTGGVARTGLTNGTGTSIAVQPDGRLVWAGSAAGAGGVSDFAVARFTSTGTLDPSFGNGGVVLTAFAGTISQGADAVLALRDLLQLVHRW